MPFCANCGKPIQEGEVCNCQNQSITSGNQNTIRKGFMVMGAGLLAGIVIIVLVFSAIFGDSYKKPVNDYIKALNNCNTKKMLSIVVPKSKMKEFKKEAKDSIIDWDAFFDKMDETLQEFTEELEDDYGKNVRFSAKILDKKKISGDDFEEIQEDYEDEYDAEVKKAYKLKVEMTTKGKDDKNTEKISLYVVKVKGDGWKLYDYDNEMNFGNVFSTSLF